MAGGDADNGKAVESDAPPVTQSIRTLRKASKPTGVRKVAKGTKVAQASDLARDFPTQELPPVTVPIVLPLNQHARMWMGLSGVLGIMLIAALVIVGYLWNVNGKWQSQVTSLTATGYDLGDRVAEHQRQIDQLNATNDLLTDQLATAKDKVLALSNDKAQWSDTAAYAQQQVDLLGDQVSGAQAVIGQLNRCIEGEQQLVSYVRDVEKYSPDQVAQFERSVDQLCTAATNANTTFQESLTE